LLPSTHQARQFEFHPLLPRVLLTGNKKGGVNVVHADEDTPLWSPLVLDTCPVLGLSWMKHHPELAVCGAAHSGKISFLKFNPDAEERTCALEPLATVESFPKLSSMSVNCSDDFLLASGFTHDLALYDVQTGRVLTRLHGAHTHFVNISRFAHRSPHIFATASFDHTCKVWDLRQPLNSSHPVRSLPTDGLNVMVTFSPDDKYLLSSGVDTRITQWELPSFRQTPNLFPLRAAIHQARYRRSMYFADSTRFVSAATDESHLRVLSTDGRNLGVVDFRGFLSQQTEKANGVVNTYGGNLETESAIPRLPATVPRLPTSPSPEPPSQPQPAARRKFLGRLMQRIEQRLRRPGRPCRATSSSSSSGSDQYHTMVDERGVHANEDRIISGKVWISEEDGNARDREYVQSIRAHPVFENQVGVLLSSYHPQPQSYIAVLDLVPNGRDR
jgi:hypothetical protein